MAQWKSLHMWSQRPHTRFIAQSQPAYIPLWWWRGDGVGLSLFPTTLWKSNITDVKILSWKQITMEMQADIMTNVGKN